MVGVAAVSPTGGNHGVGQIGGDAVAVSETAPVLVMVQSIEPVIGMGAVVALATVDPEIAGIGFRNKGVRA